MGHRISTYDDWGPSVRPLCLCAHKWYSDQVGPYHRVTRVLEKCIDWMVTKRKFLNDDSTNFWSSALLQMYIDSVANWEYLDDNEVDWDMCRKFLSIGLILLAQDLGREILSFAKITINLMSASVDLPQQLREEMSRRWDWSCVDDSENWEDKNLKKIPHQASTVQQWLNRNGVNYESILYLLLAKAYGRRNELMRARKFLSLASSKITHPKKDEQIRDLKEYLVQVEEDNGQLTMKQVMDKIQKKKWSTWDPQKTLTINFKNGPLEPWNWNYVKSSLLYLLCPHPEIVSKRLQHGHADGLENFLNLIMTDLKGEQNIERFVFYLLNLAKMINFMYFKLFQVHPNWGIPKTKEIICELAQRLSFQLEFKSNFYLQEKDGERAFIHAAYLLKDFQVKGGLTWMNRLIGQAIVVMSKEDQVNRSNAPGDIEVRREKFSILVMSILETLRALDCFPLLENQFEKIFKLIVDVSTEAGVGVGKSDKMLDPTGDDHLRTWLPKLIKFLDRTRHLLDLHNFLDFNFLANSLKLVRDFILKLKPLSTGTFDLAADLFVTYNGLSLCMAVFKNECAPDITDGQSYERILTQFFGFIHALCGAGKNVLVKVTRRRGLIKFLRGVVLKQNVITSTVGAALLYNLTSEALNQSTSLEEDSDDKNLWTASTDLVQKYREWLEDWISKRNLYLDNSTGPFVLTQGTQWAETLNCFQQLTSIPDSVKSTKGHLVSPPPPEQDIGDDNIGHWSEDRAKLFQKLINHVTQPWYELVHIDDQALGMETA